MTYSSIDIANVFIHAAIKYKVRLFPVRIHKLMYILHGYYLAKYGRPLIDESFRVGEYGPFLQSIHDECLIWNGVDGVSDYLDNDNRSYGAKPSINLCARLNDFHIPWIKDKRISDLIYRISVEFLGMNIRNMYIWTNSEETPWGILTNNGEDIPDDQYISDDLILKDFKNYINDHNCYPLLESRLPIEDNEYHNKANISFSFYDSQSDQMIEIESRQSFLRCSPHGSWNGFFILDRRVNLSGMILNMSIQIKKNGVNHNLHGISIINYCESFYQNDAQIFYFDSLTRLQKSNLEGKELQIEGDHLDENKTDWKMTDKEWRIILLKNHYIGFMPLYFKPLLEKRIEDFLKDVNIVGYAGLHIDKEIILQIAAEASLLILKYGFYKNLYIIYVHRSSFDIGRIPDLHDTPFLDGLSHSTGMIEISHHIITHSDRRRYHNTLLHECAHQFHIDVNSKSEYDDFQKIFDECYDRFKSDIKTQKKSLIGTYGALNKKEFFAMSVEVFFLNPQELIKEQPFIYQSFVNMFDLNPIEWKNDQPRIFDVLYSS